MRSKVYQFVALLVMVAASGGVQDHISTQCIVFLELQECKCPTPQRHEIICIQDTPYVNDQPEIIMILC